MPAKTSSFVPVPRRSLSTSKMDATPRKNPDEDSQISKKRNIEEIKSPVVSHLTENQQTEDLLSKVLPTVLEKITETIENKLNSHLATFQNKMDEKLKLFETKITDIVKQQEDFRCQVTELTTRTNDVLKNNRETNEKVRETSEAINVHEERIVNIEKQLEQLRTQQAIEMEEIKRNEMEKQADNLAEPMQIDNGMKKVCLEIESACRMENVEQYNRRDCLLFHGIYEHENENTTTKVMETAAAMGIFIEPTDVSISHRLATRNIARSQQNHCQFRSERSQKQSLPSQS